MSPGNAFEPVGPAVVVIGGANLDVKARSARRATAATSNPGTTTTSPGGVARNIAENLARLGTQVELISVIGTDPIGQSLLAHTRESGVGVDHVLRTDRPTGTYTAILDCQGELIVAISDMQAIDELTPDHLRSASRALGSAGIVILDGNLRPDTFAAAIDLAPGARIIVEPVSVPKVQVLAGLLDERVFAITPGRDELAAVTGLPTGSEQQVRIAARALHDRGIDVVWVSMGDQGSLLSTLDGAEVFAAFATDVVDVTGAGDAMLAAFCHVLLAGGAADDAVRLAHAAAAVTVASQHTVRPDIDRGMLEALLADQDSADRHHTDHEDADHEDTERRDSR